MRPRWASVFHLDFDVESDLEIKVSVHDDCSGKEYDLENDIDMGDVLVQVNDIYHSSLKGMAHEVILKNNRGR